jgi:hypothetical protein
LALAAEIVRRRCKPRRDDVPAHAPVADVIERGELPRQVERLGVGGRGGGNHPEPLRRRRDRCQNCDRLEPGARRLRYVLAERQLIGEED